MSGREFARLRSSLLADVRGDVLEIGFGTGLNIAHYPSTTASLTVLDPASFLPNRVRRRIASATFPVECVRSTAETLPFDSHRFDWIVSTWTLCSIADPSLALQEVHRVLNPTGRFVFLEHGRSEDQLVAAWQDRLNPVQNVLGCGCNLNRSIDRLIAGAGLHIGQLDRFSMPGVPRWAGEMYQGLAEHREAASKRCIR
ncbi:class I SAM-dependent methyltransferase [Nitrospira sp. KM1]|uniref:class I SAM-dependent methyltransferase n=1 Tax=Nitrospira sp. KM1 TaxID=1936990 RepID=UPI0018D9241B|nr:class I SAM-dependent methyltransferase [Nitrospira sp. KM1]